MRRTTVFLDAELQRELSALARRQARPAAALVREAVGQYVVAHRDASRTRLSFVAVGGSGRTDVAERHEEMLFEGSDADEGGARGPVPPPRARRPAAGPPGETARVARADGPAPGHRCSLRRCRPRRRLAWTHPSPPRVDEGAAPGPGHRPAGGLLPAPCAAGPPAERRFLQAVVDGEVTIELLADADGKRCLDILERYPEIGFVDASLVAMAERLRLSKIATTDRRHFAAIRPRHVAAFQLVPE